MYKTNVPSRTEVTCLVPGELMMESDHPEQTGSKVGNVNQ